MDSTLPPLEQIALRYLNDSLESIFSQNDDCLAISEPIHKNSYPSDSKTSPISNEMTFSNPPKLQLINPVIQPPFINEPLWHIQNTSTVFKNDGHDDFQSTLNYRKEQAFIVLQSLIRGTISQDDGVKMVRELIHKSEPADKIISILNVSSIPLPSIKSSINREYSQQLPFSNAQSNADSGFYSKSLVQKWSQNEDNRLLFGIHKFGLNDWEQISKFVGGDRTKAQCAQRWLRGLDPSILKEPWSKEEDKKLLELISIYGLKNWKKIAFQMGNRTDAQCRYRHIMINKAKRKYKSQARKKKQLSNMDSKTQNWEFDLFDDLSDNYSTVFPTYPTQTNNQVPRRTSERIAKERGSPQKTKASVGVNNLPRESTFHSDQNQEVMLPKPQGDQLKHADSQVQNKQDDTIQEIFKSSDSEWEESVLFDFQFIPTS